MNLPDWMYVNVSEQNELRFGFKCVDDSCHEVCRVRSNGQASHRLGRHFLAHHDRFLAIKCSFCNALIKSANKALVIQDGWSQDASTQSFLLTFRVFLCRVATEQHRLESFVAAIEEHITKICPKKGDTVIDNARGAETEMGAHFVSRFFQQ